MPKNSGYTVNIASTGCLVRNGKTIAVTTNNRSVHVQKQLDDFSGYEAPTQLFLTWQGKTTEGNKDVAIKVSFIPKNLLDKIDVLSELPFLLRKFIQTFITAPFLYQWCEW